MPQTSLLRGREGVNIRPKLKLLLPPSEKNSKCEYPNREKGNDISQLEAAKNEELVFKRAEGMGDPKIK